MNPFKRDMMTDDWTDDAIDAAAWEVLEDFECWEIWNAPGVLDIVLEHFGASSLCEQGLERLEREELLKIPGVREACLDDIRKSDTVIDWLERNEERQLDRLYESRGIFRRHSGIA